MAVLQEVPKFDELIPTTVAALKAIRDSASNDEIHDKVVEMLELTDEIVEVTHKGIVTSTRPSHVVAELCDRSRG